MFERLFAESGLSLDRLKAFLAVAASGSIAKATGGDPVKQSQYSRQIRELEDFFRIKLVERQGKGIRLTTNGRELARISRFFMLGLSNFQRGCLAEEQTFRIGASATFIRSFLMPAVSGGTADAGKTRYIIETAGDDEIERRLHDLTLDFGVTARAEISRPLQMAELGKWRLKLWLPRAAYKDGKAVVAAWKAGTIPLVLAHKELAASGLELPGGREARVSCDSFLDALSAMESGGQAAILPDFLLPGANSKAWSVRIPALESHIFHFNLACNPRLLRLNPHATRERDLLAQALARQMRG